MQGFGAVGANAARFLVERGATLVAAEDSRGGVARPAGLDPVRLVAHKAEGGSVASYRPGTELRPGEIVGVDCDVLIPAAQPDVLRSDNVGLVRARLVVGGANIPATLPAEATLHSRGVLVVPDFIANAGGVITAAVEYRGGCEKEASTAIEERIRGNTERVHSLPGAVTPRAAAIDMAFRRVHSAMAVRRHA